MNKSNPIRIYGAASALVVILGAQVVALADEPTGQMWRESTTMEMPGMAMPAHTMEVCVRTGKEDEALSRPQSPGMNNNCAVQDAKHDGNKFTATMICTGKQPMQGSIEVIRNGDHSTTTIVFSMNGTQMTMKTDAQKIGTPCTPKALQVPPAQ
jgi:Protein of unknown function (DUF3617)